MPIFRPEFFWILIQSEITEAGIAFQVVYRPPVPQNIGWGVEILDDLRKFLPWIFLGTIGDGSQAIESAIRLGAPLVGINRFTRQYLRIALRQRKATARSRCASETGMDC